MKHRWHRSVLCKFYAVIFQLPYSPHLNSRASFFSLSKKRKFKRYRARVFRCNSRWIHFFEERRIIYFSKYPGIFEFRQLWSCFLPRSSTRNTSKTFYAQYESSLSKSNTNRTEPLVLSDTVINVENGEFSRFIARFKKRKRNKRGEFTRERRESDASRQDPRHVASIGGGVPFVVRFHGEHRRQRAAASEPSQSTWNREQPRHRVSRCSARAPDGASPPPFKRLP